MYTPSHFVQTDPRAIEGLIRAHPLATLVTRQDDVLAADLVPMMVEPGPVDGQPVKCLIGHVARANPLWRAADGQAVLAIFNGPQTYVSPGWYPSKAAHGKVVPTWNYATAHLHGSLRAIEDRTWLRALVERLTNTHEAGRLPAAWAVDDAPTPYIDSMLDAIVGFEITVTRIEAKWKMSQNRSSADRAGVAAGLATEPTEMARRAAGWVAGEPTA